MKITILDIEPEDEEELILKCHEVTDDMLAMIQKFKSRQYVAVLKERLGL